MTLVAEENSPETRDLKASLLARFPVFAGLKPDELDAMLAEAPVMRVPAGTVLFDAKQPCRGFPLPCSVGECSCRAPMAAHSSPWTSAQEKFRGVRRCQAV